MFINEFCGIVNLIVDNYEEILLGVVFGNILKCEFLVGHFDLIVLFFCLKVNLSISIACLI